MPVQTQPIADIAVYTVDLTSSDIGLLDLLDDRERARIDRCAGEADRARFLLGAALLRAAVGPLLGVAAAAVTVDRTCSDCGRWHGRPTLPGTRLEASVSHSGLVVAVATLAGLGRVGVDVERLSDRPVAEVTDWTVKEAIFKAGGGSGLTTRELPSPMPGHVLTLATDRPDATPKLVDGTGLLRAATTPRGP